ncbi:MAG: site-2 protease family protein [Coriobacteriales bacterium]|nr:site-2 protease family protein [Coriobacteriales bacterium]
MSSFAYTWAHIWPQLLMVVLMIPAIVFHEMAHGFAAYKLGDPTAKRSGRLSANPLKHLDPFGSVVLPLILAAAGGPVFGYAKPVPYDPRHFKNLKVGEVVVGLAGPLCNLLQACVGWVLCWVGWWLLGTSPQVGYWVYLVAYYYAYINLVLMFFNLIPLPPLDGSSIIAVFLPRRAMNGYYQVQRYAMVILLALIIVIPWVTGVDVIGLYLNVTAGNLIDLPLPAHVLFGR